MGNFLLEIKYLSEYMHITVTSVSSQETNQKLNKFSVHLEESLNDSLKDEDFGPISRFMFVVVSVFDDKEKNDFFLKKHNKSGTYTHPVTKEKVRYFSIAIPYSPTKILGSSEMELRKDLCAEIIHCIENRQVTIPKGVEYDRFAVKTKLAFANYGKYNF
jgi:hypothetical protein